MISRKFGSKQEGVNLRLAGEFEKQRGRGRGKGKARGRGRTPMV